jgi:SulP family sulfate permease
MDKMKKLFSNFRGDLFGGLTAGIVALPLALAFGVSSGLGPSAGLYGAIFISFFAAIFGGTATQISGPTAPMTAVSMVFIAGIVALNDGDLTKALPIILAVFLLAGLVQIGLGILGFGQYIKYIPYPVVSGFMTAIGLIILITQFSPMLGYYPKEDVSYVQTFKAEAEELILENILRDEAGEGILVLEDFEETINRAHDISEEEILQESKTLAKKEASSVLGSLKVLPAAIRNIHWLEFLLALSTIIIIYGFKRITTKVPSTLVALLVVSAVAIGLGLDYRAIEQIPSGIPIPKLEIFSGFKFGSISPYIFTAITLAFLGAIDSLLTSVVADNMTKTHHKPNKELIGQGIGNSIAAIFGGLPGAGATIRTVVNINAGGKTKLSGMISGVLLLFILLTLGPVASKIPAAVLAGILITVGIGVMDYKGLRAIPFLQKDVQIGPIKLSSEVIIMIAVMLLATFWNLIYAVGIGLVISSLTFMKKIGDLSGERSAVKTLDKSEELWDDEANFPQKMKEEVYIKHLDGPLFFGSTSEFQKLTSQIPVSASHVIIRMDKVPYMDQSGLYAIEEALLTLCKQDISVLFVGIQDQPRKRLERIKILNDLIPKEHVFESFKDCLNYIQINVEDQD